MEPIVKTGTFRQVGFTAQRRPDGSFEPACRLWIEDGTVPEQSFHDMVSEFARQIRPYIERELGAASA